MIPLCTVRDTVTLKEGPPMNETATEEAKPATKKKAAKKKAAKKKAAKKKTAKKKDFQIKGLRWGAA